mmetsp:Transcript_28866/g.73657  ORF Transcript_28866/g.73657 Transcript_28866/m.73657 type:complete len:401 (-) Transcript_28866:254-1456(-)|eukprot:CAMPEP_0202867588 /NCGR_PEP_ID=MMETSP1391-20130828/9515_1 /ASSEMBLY_ACC=CAM_ASM_000867 /TAXON_ID=1034604 /ORGANISM="Chlamydomonas leiostraca, Strain SAG 11-49" /LENGTH=400 /DNA_ID=CAMNT_0049547641 /DNA_START=166 /DNA_END=1368 /DNA_ORIENTATION=+
MSSVDEENFNYRDEEIAYSGEEDDYNQGTAKSTVVQNQPHDEEVALSDTESFARDDPPNVKDASLIESHDMDEMPASSKREAPASTGYGGQEARPGRLGTMPQDSNDGSTSPAGDDVPGAYNAMEFKHLNVSDDIRQLFQHIGRYKPHNIDLETKLKPFIPDYIPSIGGIDEFIKVPRPDGKPDFLGLKVLDEPAARQSDPTVLTLQLRQLSKEAPGNQAEMVGRIEHTDEQKMKKVAGWVASIQDIHKNKPPATVTYSRRMPDIEALMQEWPPEMEAFIKNMKMPSGDLDLDLRTLTKLVCSILDIPVYENPVESLHVLFTLYLEFKHNPIFSHQVADMDNRGAMGTPSGGANVYGLAGEGSAAGGDGGWGRGASAGGMGMGAAGMGGSSSGANVMTFS